MRSKYSSKTWCNIPSFSSSKEAATGKDHLFWQQSAQEWCMTMKCIKDDAKVDRGWHPLWYLPLNVLEKTHCMAVSWTQKCNVENNMATAHWFICTSSIQKYDIKHEIAWDSKNTNFKKYKIYMLQQDYTLCKMLQNCPNLDWAVL